MSFGQPQISNADGSLPPAARQQRISISLTPYYSSSTQTFAQGSTTSLTAKYESTFLYSDASGTPFTGLDPSATRVGSPTLPIARYDYDRVSVDSEGLVVAGDGTFWVSDEYGPYICELFRRADQQKSSLILVAPLRRPHRHRWTPDLDACPSQIDRPLQKRRPQLHSAQAARLGPRRQPGL